MIIINKITRFKLSGTGTTLWCFHVNLHTSVFLVDPCETPPEYNNRHIYSCGKLPVYIPPYQKPPPPATATQPQPPVRSELLARFWMEIATDGLGTILFRDYFQIGIVNKALGHKTNPSDIIWTNMKRVSFGAILKMLLT